MTNETRSPNREWLPLLLADPSPCLRWLVMRELMARPDEDQEVAELAALRQYDVLVSDLVAQQQPDGSWPRGESGVTGSQIQRTAQALTRLGYLGFGPELPAVTRGAEYLFSVQGVDGAWPLAGEGSNRSKYQNYDCIPLQTALPLRGLAACGYATDARSERAYEWLLATRLADGAWPTGHVSGSLGYVAGYRRLAHSRWGCRSNTTGALICLALHPERRRGVEAARGLDLLLGRETSERQTLGFDLARTLGFEAARGFFTYYGPFDLALLLYLCWQIGAPIDDDRIERALSIVQDSRGDYSLWRYLNRPTASRWLTFDLLRTLSGLDASGEWFSLEPRTPFSPYPAHGKRY